MNLSTVLWVYVNIVVFLSSSVFVNSICLHLCHAVRKKMDRGRCHVRKWIEGAVVGVCFSRFSLLAVISYIVFSTVCQVSSRAFYMGELGNYMTSSGTLTKKTRFLLENLSLISWNARNKNNLLMKYKFFCTINPNIDWSRLYHVSWT